MSDTRSGPEGIAVPWRKRLQDALHQLNSATLQLQVVLQDYGSRATPSPDGDLAFRKALRAETEARHEYMKVAMTIQDLVLHGKIPTEGVAEVVVVNSGSE
jgi:hypothetical protein